MSKRQILYDDSQPQGSRLPVAVYAELQAAGGGGGPGPVVAGGTVVNYITSSATPAVNLDAGFDIEVDITDLTTNITSMTSGVTGTPRNGMHLTYFIYSSAARNITWGSLFESSGSVTLPTVTQAGKEIAVLLIYRERAQKFRCMAVDATGAGVVVPPGPTGNPLWVGGYETNNWNQWLYVQNRDLNGASAGYPAGGVGPNNWLAQIVTDPGGRPGKVARFEMRPGFGVPNDSGAGSALERTEVMSPQTTQASEGMTRWYQFATKFDSTFPLNHADLGFGTTNQWHSVGWAAPLTFTCNARNGYWTMTAERRDSAGNFIDLVRLYETPIDRGNWHEIVCEIKWSGSDTTGYIRMIRNGVQQTMLNGSQTYTIRTLYPIANEYTYYKEGYYSAANSATRIVWHDSAACAATQADLPGFP